jgi:hypothetical protein
MRIRTIFIAILLGTCIFPLFSEAQVKKNVEDRVAAAHQLFDAKFNFDATKMSRIDEIFTQFYASQDKLRDNIQAPPSSGLVQGLVAQDFQSVRKSNENIISERDTRLKKLLGAEDFKKWQVEIEPALRNVKKR